MSRRWRNPTLAVRRRRFDPPWVGAAPAPPPALPGFRDQAGIRPRLHPLARRGRFSTAPPVPPAVTQPPPPTYVDQTRAWSRAVKVRAGRFQTVPSTLPVPPARESTTRRLKALRRGRFFSLPLAVQTTAGPGPIPPSLLRQTHRPALPTRRGTFTQPVWPQQSPALPPSFPPSWRRPTTRAVLVRRGAFQIVPTGRGDVPAKLLRQPARRLVITRRGKFLLVPPAVSLTVPSSVPPKMLRPPGRKPQVRRRSGFQLVPLVGATPAAPGFVCQDFSAVAAVDAHAGIAIVDTLNAAAVIDSYSGGAALDSYGGTATNCGR